MILNRHLISLFPILITIALAGCINANANYSYWHGYSGSSKLNDLSTKVEIQNTVISPDNQIVSFTLVDSDKMASKEAVMEKRGYDLIKFQAIVNEVLAEKSLINPNSGTGLTMQVTVLNLRLPSNAESKLINSSELGMAEAIMEATITDKNGTVVAKYRYSDENECRLCSYEQNATVLFRTIGTATAYAISTKGH